MVSGKAICLRTLRPNATQLQLTFSIRCLLWFDNIRDPVLVQVTDYYNIWPNKWRPHVKYGTYHPQILTCPLPVEHVGQVPRAVSLQARGQCSQVERHPSNVLRVLNHQRDTRARKKHNFGICVQSFRFVTYDVSVRLVEWLEMMQQLGADKVYLYALGTTEALRKVLQYYEKKVRPSFYRPIDPSIDSPSFTGVGRVETVHSRR